MSMKFGNHELFQNIDAGEGVHVSKFMKFARWRDFNALRRAHVSFQVTRRVVAPKSNIVYRGNCSTKGGRLINALSDFDLHFRDHK